jgi:hypothetical protein
MRKIPAHGNGEGTNRTRSVEAFDLLEGGFDFLFSHIAYPRNGGNIPKAFMRGNPHR